MQAFRKLRRLPLTFLALGLALSAAACGSATSSSSTQTSKSPSMPGMSSSTTMSSAKGMAQKTAPVSCAAPSAGSQTAMTASRVFTLSLGPAETMYSRQQVRRTHPKEGEVMLAGQMQGAGMSGMSSGSAMPGMAAMKHLEVHICTRNGRKVVTGPPPSIRLKSGRSTQMVPVAVMEGVGEGVADLHFGNNVQVRSGRAYTVHVTDGTDYAVFHFVAK